MSKIRTLAMELSPDSFRLIDQELLKNARAELTPARLREIGAERSREGLSPLSDQQIITRELDRAAILKPIDLMSFPNPHVRVAFIARFGAASSADCLRDIYELDPSPLVKLEVVSAAHRRFFAHELSDPVEARKLVVFASERVRAGYYLGKDVESARAALSMLRRRPEAEIPEVLRGISTSYWSGPPIASLGAFDRIGVMRLYGEHMNALEIVEALEAEHDPDVLEVLLPQLEENWDLGVAPDGYGSDFLLRGDLSRRIARTLAEKLGLDELQLGLRKGFLAAPRRAGEKTADFLMRRLAYRAHLESSRAESEEDTDE